MKPQLKLVETKPDKDALLVRELEKELGVKGMSNVIRESLRLAREAVKKI